MIYYQYPSHRYPPSVANPNMRYPNIMPNANSQNIRHSSTLPNANTQNTNTQSSRSNFNNYNNQNFRNKYYAPANQSIQSQHQVQAINQIDATQEKRGNLNKTDENALFEIFGIKLYFDDILLICLIFFLYNEGVQDQYLFIVLVLLLLS